MSDTTIAVAIYAGLGLLIALAIFAGALWFANAARCGNMRLKRRRRATPEE